MRAASGGLESSTLRNDARNVRTLCREFGMMPISDITPGDVRDGLAHLRNGGGASGRTLSGTYMSSLYIALNAIMSQAADDGITASNPCERVKPPRVDTAERTALSPDQLDAAFDRIQDALYDAPRGRYMALLLMLDCGLRSQEAFALSPDDVDLAAGMLHVRHALKADGIGKPKSEAGRRDLPMTRRLVDSCAVWESFEREWFPDAATLCCDDSGEIADLGSMRKWFARHSVDLGCMGLTFHELRHSNLSKMARYMSPFDLQRWAGWSTLAPAMVYVHDDMDALSRAVSIAQGDR